MNSLNPYLGNLQFVLGDVKQAFIQNKVFTETHVDNMLNGFETMQVNGIRIPIFAAGHLPNLEMFDYFYEQAVERGFKLFANPALHGGGRRIANGVLFCDSLGGPVLDDPLKTQNLIDRIIEFANEYPCDWINPFNEDGRPGNQWTTEQFNTIYASLSDQLNGAELLGACQWGIQAGIQTFEQTHIDQYITIATTHNLGFQHELWPDYIVLATEKGLPVWDSEANNYTPDGNISRIAAAIAAGVDGLVLYDSWKGINQGTGELSHALLEIMEMYLDTSTASLQKTPENSLEVKVYPNPASETVMIKAEGFVNEYVMEIIDFRGNVVLSQQHYENFTITNIDGLTAGFYIVRVKSEGFEATDKFVVK